MSGKKLLRCNNCGNTLSIIDKVLDANDKLDKETHLSLIKWDKIYKNKLHTGEYNEDYSKYQQEYMKSDYQLLNKYKKINKKTVYLEIGCGMFFLGQSIAKKCKMVVGIDLSQNALNIAKKMLDAKKVKNYLLIKGNITNIPIMNNSVDLICGIGVIEHFRNTDECVKELHRVLRKHGVSYNSVPYLNLASLTYRQIWGNIPNVPLLRQLAEFVHITLLKKKHMIFGYELSFTKSHLRMIHKKAGFKHISVDKADVKPAFNFLPIFMRKPFIWLANNNELFWPMIKVVGVK